MDELIGDPMYETVIVQLDCAECCACRKRAELLWAWDGVDKSLIVQDKAAARRAFARSAVGALRASGWQTIGDGIYCPDCARQRG